MNCQGIFGRLFGHSYEARHSVSEPTIQLKTMNSLVFADEMCAILETSKRRIYHHDICTRCGHVVPEKEAA